MTVLLEVPPGDPGTPPHRHSCPLSAYVLEGEMLFELEGQPERVVRAGEAVYEPGGDVIHYQTANNRPDTWLRFLATMIMVPGQPMYTWSATRNSNSAATAGHSGPPELPGRRLPQSRPVARGDDRQRPWDAAALGTGPANLHPLHPGPGPPNSVAGSHDQRGRRGDASSPVRRPIAPVEPFVLRLDARQVVGHPGATALTTST